ncbi:hypothetical protein K0B04_00430 [Patescibacteria group bacterium]|nr:hypothetical protein [Patescibacteria group bacterium]
MGKGCNNFPILLEYVESIKIIPATISIEAQSKAELKEGCVSVGKELEIGKTYYFSYSTRKSGEFFKMTILEELSRKGKHDFKYRVSFS